MAVAATPIERVADTLVERAAEVFTHVALLDSHGTVVASTGCDPDKLAAEPGGASEPIRVPIRLGHEAAVLLVAQPVHGETISPHLAQVLVRLMVDQTLAVTQLPNQHELKSTFLHALLRGEVGDEAEIVREGQLLGMDLTIPRAVILVDASRYVLAHDMPGRPEAREAQRRRRVQVVIASIVGFFSLPSDTICAYIGNGEIAVLKASSSGDLVAWVDGRDGPEALRSSWANLTALKRAAADLLARLRLDTRSQISIGIGRYHPGIRGLAHSYQDALAALSLGTRLEGPNAVHCLDGLGMAAFVGVSDQRTKLDLATHLLSPLDHEPELMETIEAFFNHDCCPSAAAGHLTIHRNTLSYRLDKVAALTGLDPRRFNDAVQIRLALLIRAF